MGRRDEIAQHGLTFADGFAAAGRIGRERPWVVAMLLGLVTFLVFLPSVACDFVNWDDDKYVFANPLVLRGLSPTGVRRAFTDVVFCNWAPLTILSYQLDVTLLGSKPWAFHLTNVLLHASASAILFLAIARLTGCVGRSAAATLLFAVHPLRVESVAWIAERKDVLSVLFLSLGLLAYERYRGRPTRAGFMGVFLAMLCSLLCKATLVTLPALLIVLDFWPLGRLPVPGCHDRGSGNHRCWKLAMLEKLPLFLLAAAFSVITLRTQAEAIQSEASLPLWSVRVPNAVSAMGWYVVKTFVPTGLHPACRHPGITGRPQEWFSCGVIICGAIALIVGLTWRRLPAVAAGLVWFVIALSPVLGIAAQQGFQAYADRFTYVPHIGLMLAVVWGADALVRRAGWNQRVAVVGLVAAIVAAVAIDRFQIGIWKDSQTLWSHVLALEPDDNLAHCNMGVALLEKGRVDEAHGHFVRSLAIKETERAHSWMGLILSGQGRPEEAIAEYRAGLALDPGSIETHTNLGIALATQGRLAEALPHFERACEIDPTDDESRANLDRARRELGISREP